MSRKRYLWPLLFIGTAGCIAAPHIAHAEGAYAVFQYSVRLKAFDRLPDAVAYARLWDHSRVVNLQTGDDEWDNYPSPVADLGYWVVQRGQRMDSAWTRDEAENKASRIPGSIVLNALTGTVVWRNSETAQPVTGTTPQPAAPPDDLSSRGSIPSPGKASGTPPSGGAAPAPAVPPPSRSGEGAGSGPVWRVPDRPAPYGPDYYQVQGGTLLHIFGTPGAPPRASVVIGPAPDFMKSGQVYVRDSSHRFYLRGPSGDQPVGSWEPPYETLDLRTPSKISGADIDNFIRTNHPESPMIGLGDVFVQAQRQYGVNAQYLAAHAILESGWGLSSIAVNKKNLFGYGAYDQDPYRSAATFASFEDSIRFIAYFVRNQYLEPGGRWFGGSPTLDGMNVHYATDPDWGEKIAALMERMRPYQPADYRGVAPLPAPAAVQAPPGPIVQPPEPTAGVSSPPGTPNAGSGQALIVRVDDALNVRSGPGTSFSVITRVPDRTILSPVTGAGGKPTLVNNWYHVRLSDGSDGWVYGDYVAPAPSA